MIDGFMDWVWNNQDGIDNDSFLGDEVLGGTHQNTFSPLAKAHF